MILRQTLQNTARSANENNNHTQLCINKIKQTSQINVPFIITTQTVHTKYNKFMDQQYNIVFKQYNKYATIVVHANSTILP
jgi:hypothetical protein